MIVVGGDQRSKSRDNWATTPEPRDMAGLPGSYETATNMFPILDRLRIGENGMLFRIAQGLETAAAGAEVRVAECDVEVAASPRPPRLDIIEICRSQGAFAATLLPM